KLVAERHLRLASEEHRCLAGIFRPRKSARTAAHRPCRAALDVDRTWPKRRQTRCHAVHQRAAYFALVDIAKPDGRRWPAFERRGPPVHLWPVQARRQAHGTEQRFDDLNVLAHDAGLTAADISPMPANNLVLAFARPLRQN